MTKPPAKVALATLIVLECPTGLEPASLGVHDKSFCSAR